MKLLRFPVEERSGGGDLPDAEKVPGISGNSKGGFQLAKRYRRVLVLLADGCTPNEIADLLQIQPMTAWAYIEDVFIKNREMSRTLAAHALSLLHARQRNG
jgi:DNA-binding CsgD family transcriptional regulator